MNAQELPDHTVTRCANRSNLPLRLPACFPFTPSFAVPQTA
jgi:hypothetical protein